MKITDVKTVLLSGLCTNDPYLAAPGKYRSTEFIEIHADTELPGVGETDNRILVLYDLGGWSKGMNRDIYGRFVEVALTARGRRDP